MIGLIIIIVYNIFYALLEGYREGYYYHVVMLLHEEFKREMHSVFTIQRILFFSLAIFFFHWLIALCIFSGEIFCFAFFHDGMYYVTRNQLNPNVYPLKWKAESTTSTAKMELNWPQRVVFLTVGIAFYLYAIWLFTHL